MTKKTRYVLFGSAGALLAGLATGLVAYLAYTRSGPLPDGLPPEVRYVPANAEVVAFANVRSVMNSELRRELLPASSSSSAIAEARHATTTAPRSSCIASTRTTWPSESCPLISSR